MFWNECSVMTGARLGAQAEIREQVRCIIWCMKRTNIYLEERQTEALDQLASKEGVSRAEVIRRLLDRAIGGADDHLERDLGAIEASFGVLDQLEEPRRAHGDREEHLARMWRRDS